MTHHITVDEVMALHPCSDFPRERVSGLIGDGKTALEIAEMADVSVSARLWLLLRTPYLSDRQLREFACDCANRALARVGQPDPRSAEAVAVARRFAAGDATREELDTARAAAKAAWAAVAAAGAARAAADAAWDAAAAADAAWAAVAAADAAWDAAWDAAAAAWDAARAAVAAAGAAVAANAEELWQIHRVSEVLRASADAACVARAAQ